MLGAASPAATSIFVVLTPWYSAFIALWSTGAQSCGQALGLEPSLVAEGMCLVTRARHGDGVGGLVVEALKPGTHHSGVNGGFLPSPCLAQFLVALGQGVQAAFSKHLQPWTAVLLCTACPREGFLSCCLSILGPGNRHSSHGICWAETIAAGEPLQLANYS